MDGFRFRLQPVLEHAHRQYEQACHALARAQEFLQREMQALSDIETREQDHRRQFRGTNRKGGLTVEELLQCVRYLDRLAEEKKQQRQTVDEREREVCRCVQELLRLSKDKKVIEKLKDKQLKDFLREVSAQEQKLIDACAISRYCRRKTKPEAGA